MKIFYKEMKCCLECPHNRDFFMAANKYNECLLLLHSKNTTMLDYLSIIMETKVNRNCPL